MHVQKADMLKKRDPHQSFAKAHAQTVIFVHMEAIRVKCMNVGPLVDWHQEDTRRILSRPQCTARRVCTQALLFQLG